MDRQGTLPVVTRARRRPGSLLRVYSLLSPPADRLCSFSSCRRLDTRVEPVGTVLFALTCPSHRLVDPQEG